ncbi:uncharacterized protein LOC141664953 [Apium graveolens]|uniref:uncharacterized protein LOC141664953 n=1 Tax=Apium graveolens TaxID=4045 RepID=UPI003D7BBDE0
MRLHLDKKQRDKSKDVKDDETAIPDEDDEEQQLLEREQSPLLENRECKDKQRIKGSPYRVFRWIHGPIRLHQFVYQRNEDLRAYLTRFCAHIAKITDLVDPLSVSYLIAGIDRSRHSQLLEELFEKEPKTLQAAIKIIEHRLTLQEAVESIQHSRSPKLRYDRSPRRPRDYEKSDGTRQQQQERPRGTRQSQSSPTSHIYHKSRFTEEPTHHGGKQPTSRSKDYQEPIKLNTDKETILAILKTDPSYRPPRPMNPNRPPSSKYCDYHEDTGHETETCFQLTNLKEEKVRDGHLARYLDNLQLHRSQSHDSDRVIDVISGGYSAGGSSNNSKKLYARDVYRIESKRPRKNPTPVISFSDEDYTDDIIEDHQDALIITTKIGTNTVKKILVDNGSSENILYYSAFSKMDLGDRKLDTAKATPLYGFTGNEVKLVGIVDLHVLFGSPPCQVWQGVKFYVVNAKSNFNAIIGRTIIGPLRAITSIAHLKMKFPTEFGVGEICGDQRASRQCYIGNSIPKKRNPQTE